MIADPNPALPRRISPRWLFAVAAVVVLGFAVICGSVLFSMRRGDEDMARQALGNLAAAVDADINRNLEIYDLSLRAVAGNMVVPEIGAVSKTLRHLILFDHAATARHFGAIQVMDPSGQVIIDSSTLDPPAQNFSGDEFFEVHRRDALFGLYISKPMLHQGAYGVVLSRRIAGRDGTFLGVVSGFIRYSYFHELVDRLELDSHDLITVIRQDGVVIMRSPFDLDIIGKDISKLPGVQKTLAYISGSFSGRGANDDIERLFVWRDGSHPLIVVVGRSTATILGQWHHDVLYIGGAMGALGAIALGVMLILVREMRLRAVVEIRMARLAMTDGLTGLGNRRLFDATLEEEWRRAQRTLTPVALLMIDADHFKAFNDDFGHQAGDAVLVGIARCIGNSARRATDCPARYGGEEFALILPDCTLPDAIALGERIRAEVARSAFHGERSVTVSVGAASITPAASDAAALIKAADGALYSAKAHGRNQTFPVPVAALRRIA
jgi:diguanylate cyclase (GGDEF)-like protein